MKYVFTCFMSKIEVKKIIKVAHCPCSLSHYMFQRRKLHGLLHTLMQLTRRILNLQSVFQRKYSWPRVGFEPRTTG